MKYIAVYHRQADGTPDGLVIATRVNGEVRFGWSSCDKRDKFSKERAKEIALGRAQKGSEKPIPSSISSVVDNVLLERCEKYFHERVLPPPFFMKSNDGKKKLIEV